MAARCIHKSCKFQENPKFLKLQVQFCRAPSLYNWRRQWQPTPVLLPGNSHGRRSLVGCSPWGREETDTTEWLHFHFSLSLIGEGNGNPLQRSCLENPRDGGAWWAAVYGVAQSRTQLKRLSSSSSSNPQIVFLYQKIIALNIFLTKTFEQLYEEGGGKAESQKRK